MSITFSREVRLGDIFTVLGVAATTVAALSSLSTRVEFLEKANAQQVQTNKEIRQDLHESTTAIGADIKELRQDVGAIRDKMNRARL